MHESVQEFVGAKVSQYGLSRLSVLDIGSRNYNGSPRHHFHGPYVGMDMLEGDGVDVVGNSHHLPFSSGTFDVVLSVEHLEHDARFWVSMREMGRVLKPGGWLILTTRGIGFPLHAYPWDYWRFTLETCPILAAEAGVELVESQEDPQEGHPGIMMVGRKPLTCGNI